MFSNINDQGGLRGFSESYLTGNKKLVFNYEADIFVPLKLLGFQLAVIIFADFGLISSSKSSLFASTLYQGYGFGFRIRNEHFIFPPFQLMFGFYPNTPQAGGRALQHVSTEFNVLPVQSVSVFHPFGCFGALEKTLLDPRTPWTPFTLGGQGMIHTHTPTMCLTTEGLYTMVLVIFLKGLIIGFAMAVPIGPVGIMCIRKTLAEGHSRGLIIGLGAATADSLYGSIAAFGLTFISDVIASQQFWAASGWRRIALVSWNKDDFVPSARIL